MKKVLLMVLAFTSMTMVKAQNTTGTDTATVKKDVYNYDMWQVGYARNAACNGAYLGFLYGRSVWKELTVDCGVRAGWRMWSNPAPKGDDQHFMELKVPIGLGYVISLGKEGALIPRTGANLGVIMSLSSDGSTSFAMGWDVGAILKLNKKYYLTYEYTFGITGQGDEHHAGIGIKF